ncbi:hypothetical protein NAI57_11295, partial [Francisella tularensis subsp. holarctica]|nr:hypothetical protein [Francisella tularensis subsp. holarctica]
MYLETHKFTTGAGAIGGTAGSKQVIFEPAGPPMTQAPGEKFSFSQAMTLQELATDLNVALRSSGG